MNENEVELPEASNPNNPPQTNPEILPPSTRIMPNLEPERVNVNKENKNNNINNENKDEKEEFQQVVFMKPNSNYFFQIFLVIHSIYTFIYFILELIIFIRLYIRQLIINYLLLSLKSFINCFRIDFISLSLS